MQGTLIMHISILSIVHINDTCLKCLLARCQQSCQNWWCPQGHDIMHPSSIYQFWSKSTALQGTFIIHISNLSIVHMNYTCFNCMLATCQQSRKIQWCPQEHVIMHLPAIFQFWNKSTALQGTFTIHIANPKKKFCPPSWAL